MSSVTLLETFTRYLLHTRNKISKNRVEMFIGDFCYDNAFVVGVMAEVEASEYFGMTM
jgi:hypothetical protein